MTLESPSRIEPAGFEEVIPVAVSDLVVEVQSLALSLGRGIHPDTAAEMAAMVRLMNSWYSNRIEGHNTRPRDIEAALAGRLDEVEDRALALEAAALVKVQEWIDNLAASGLLPPPYEVAFIREIHRRFYAEMPEQYRFVEFQGQTLPIIPGEFRAAGQEVVAGRHIPPAAQHLPAFMQHYERRYRGLMTQPGARLRTLPAAHHRLAYIHPFLDGNGRVGRLMSHAMCLWSGVGSAGLWSISRGLARGLTDPREYMSRMESADMPRQGDRDGRGNLSLAALEGFSRWFLQVMQDQIGFMTGLFDLENLNERYSLLVRDITAGDERVWQIVAHCLKHGEMARGEAGIVLRIPQRTASEVLGRAVEKGFVVSRTPKTPVRVAFPSQFRERLFPNLFA